MMDIIEEVMTPENVKAYDPFELISMIAEKFNYVCIDRFRFEYIKINNEGEFEEVKDIDDLMDNIFPRFIQKLKDVKNKM